MRAHALVDRTTAYRGIHRPASNDEAAAGAGRLTFDEFLRMQVGLVARKRALERDQQRDRARASTARCVPAFHATLPFPLTADQERALAEIVQRHGRARRRCTGCCRARSGRARRSSRSAALLIAVQGGYQGAFMAPTEVLAEQHELTLRRCSTASRARGGDRCSGERPVAVALLTNRTSAAERRRIAEGLRAGDDRHPRRARTRSIYEGVEFARARRGGDRRAAPLRRRAARPAEGPRASRAAPGLGAERPRQGSGEPDVLVMTATPIPRTAAMLIYGDLDRSELRELPAGRSPITTEIVGPSPLERVAVYDRLRAEVAAGRQAYVVCPLVEGSERIAGQGGDGGARAARRRGARGAAARAAARADAVRRQGSGDAGVPRAATSTCSWRRP